MKMIRKLLLLGAFAFVLTSCNTISTGNPSDLRLLAPKDSKKVLSPFTQFESLEKSDEIGINSEQVNDILRSYGIYNRIVEKITEKEYIESDYSDIKINAFSIGNKKVAVLLLEKVHLHIYVMFSYSFDEWTVEGFTYQLERYEPEYRIEQSSDESKYWLVVRHEANHGTGLQIFNEIWYNPDGSVAAEYPLEGSSEFFPQIIEPMAQANFSTSVNYDGHSTIFLSYSVSFIYSYKNNFQSSYSPVIREYWEYDLKTQQLTFVLCDPILPESFNMMKHDVSADFGILQGYIDFYRMQLVNIKITTLAEWERFIGQK